MSIRNNKNKMAKTAHKLATKDKPLHTCSQCKATDKSHPQLEFRYRNELCYCQVCLKKNPVESSS